MEYRARKDINAEFKRGDVIPGAVAESWPKFPGLLSTRMVEPIFDVAPMAKAASAALAVDATQVAGKRKRAASKRKAKK